MTAGGFAEFKQTVGPTLMELNDRMDAMGAASPFEVSVAGISEQHGPSGFRITSLEAGSEHLEPWRAFEFPRGFSPCRSNTEADEQKIRSALPPHRQNLRDTPSPCWKLSVISPGETTLPQAASARGSFIGGMNRWARHRTNAAGLPSNHPPAKSGGKSMANGSHRAARILH